MSIVCTDIFFNHDGTKKKHSPYSLSSNNPLLRRLPKQHQQPMHPKDTIILQTAGSVIAVLVTYLFLSIQRSHSTLLTSRLRAHNITSPTTIHLFVFANGDLPTLKRHIQALDSADYRHMPVNLTILGNRSVVHKLASWRHGAYQFTRRLQQLSGDTLIIVLDDRMEPSPMHALWFLENKGTLTAGGGIESINGIAMGIAVWNGFVQVAKHHNYSAVVAYVSTLPNASITFPSVGKYTFVRSEWQNPVYIERAPKLMRSWDPERAWGRRTVKL